MKNRSRGERKIKIKSKLNLIYNSKLKSDFIGRDTSSKTRILTQDSTRNDPMDHRIKGFLFCNFEDDCWHSRNEFSLSDTP